MQHSDAFTLHYTKNIPMHAYTEGLLYSLGACCQATDAESAVLKPMVPTIDTGRSSRVPVVLPDVTQEFLCSLILCMCKHSTSTEGTKPNENHTPHMTVVLCKHHADDLVITTASMHSYALNDSTPLQLDPAVTTLGGLIASSHI